MMDNKDRWFIVVTLTCICALTLFDLITDFNEGVTWWHVLVEGLIALFAGFGAFILLRGTFSLKLSLANERIISENLKDESLKWKEHSRKFIRGLSQTIDEQLTSWELTKSEKEVAFLLLKGFSLKEVAEVRDTTEKTARTQSTSIYSKAGLSSRSQLSAFFLEDLLLPSE